MAALFPSVDWLEAFKDKLNSDEKYAHIAHKWEGDIMFQIEPGGPVSKPVYFYLDLWHGKCRDAYMIQAEQPQSSKAAYILAAPYENFVKLLRGELDPMQAMITRKLKVQGSMAYMMRNVPVVLDFVRCAKEIETDFLE
jgi:putative sterol carrier protein